MNVDKLVKQIRREAAANPKKAAALGLMLLVAAYFWGPLVLKFAGSGDGKRATKESMSHLILTDDPAEPTQQSKARSIGGKFRWEKARELIHRDPRMVSAVFDKAWVDPFAKSAVAPQPSATQATAMASAAESESSFDPRDLGIAVTSIMLGSQRVAIVNRQPVREGDMLQIRSKDSTNVVAQLRVNRIKQGAVELDYQGRPLVIELSQPGLAQGDSIRGGKQARK